MKTVIHGGTCVGIALTAAVIPCSIVAAIVVMGALFCFSVGRRSALPESDVERPAELPVLMFMYGASLLVGSFVNLIFLATMLAKGAK